MNVVGLLLSCYVSTHESLAFLQLLEDNTVERSRNLLFMILLDVDVFDNLFCAERF